MSGPLSAATLVMLATGRHPLGSRAAPAARVAMHDLDDKLTARMKQLADHSIGLQHA